MKPINSREKSRQLWQFVIIVFGLAVIPAALIFFSYYKVPEEISKAEEEKLVNYSNFEHTQKLIVKKMIEVDSNINRYADARTEDPEILRKEIVDGLAELAKMDTSIKMAQYVSLGYTKHYTHVKELVQAQEKLKEAQQKLREAESKVTEFAELKARLNNSMNSREMPYPSER